MKQSYLIDMDPKSEWMIVSAGAGAKEYLPYVQEIGDFYARGKYYTTREGLPSFLIKYTVSGEGRLIYEGQDVYVPSGSFYWIDCQKPQHYRTSERTGNWHVLWVHFYGAGCEYLYRQFLSANGGENCAELPAGNTVTESLYRLMELYRHKTAADTDIRAAALLMEVLSECIRAAGSRSDTAVPEYVRQAQDYIAAHFGETVTLDVLAKNISINKYYLQKLFRRYTGQSPNDYLTQTRVARAKELLRTTENPVSAVAAEIGFESTSHFIRIFKIREGVTPAEYRRVWRFRGL